MSANSFEEMEEMQVELEHWRTAAASVGETDGHGWVETTNSLKSEVGRLSRRDDLNKRRLDWLHAGSGTDADGYEWGVYRVKWKDGNPVSVLHTAADFSDLDAEMGREEQARSFPALLQEVSDRALDNMEGEDLDGFKNWERVHVLAQELAAAISKAEGPR